MKDMTAEKAQETYGFNPDQIFPNRDFWCVEDGLLVISLPHKELLDPAEQALLDTVDIDPSTYPNFIWRKDVGGSDEYCFKSLYADVMPFSVTPPKCSAWRRVVNALSHLPAVLMPV